MGIATPVILATVALVNLLIGYYVFRRDSNSNANRSFALLAAAISLWACAVAFSHFHQTSHLWNLRLAFLAASFIPIALLNFVLSVPPVAACAPWFSRWTFSVMATFFGTASLTPLIGSSLIRHELGFTAVYGPLHGPFTLYVVSGFLLSIAILVVKLRRSHGLARTQLKYLVLAFGLSSALATITNLLIPVFLKTSAFSKYGPLASLLLLGLVGHTIVRHRFMDIRVVAKRGVVYIIAGVSSCAIVVCLIVTANALLHDNHSVPYREIFFALAVSAFFAPIKRTVERGVDRYLYREPYNYRQTIRHASRVLADTIELEEVVVCVQDLVNQTLRPESVAVYLDSEGELYVQMTDDAAGFPPSIGKDLFLVREATRTRNSIFLAEVVAKIKIDSTSVSLGLADDLARLSAHAVIPLLSDTGLVGLLVLGPKRSGEPYYSDDADLLATLGNHAVVAIRNALAHQRVVLLNEELMKILGTIESGVIAVGANRKVSLFNGAAQEFTALPGDSVLGHDAGQLPPPLGAFLEAALRERASHSQEEFTLPDAAGQRRSLVCSTTPLLNPRGDVVGAVAVLGDLSRLKELELERRRLERLGSLESIASGLVHEIRNPLLAVKTFAQLMPARHLEGEFRDTFSRVTAREIGRIEQLLNRFRALATTSAQPMGPVDIRVPIRDALEALHPQIEAQRVTLRQVADGMPRPIVGNTSQLEQLFLNLCLNALQAMESGGELTVRVADLSEGGGTTLVVEVSDTGPGIPEDQLETIFNPFVTTKPGGTGLGLAICRGIADAHQAKLTAENHVERPGCTFTLEFPVAAGERARTRS